MDPITMIAIAQVCVSVYAASRSSGPGIAGLLAAQTKMLVEITKQITIINKKLDAIYLSIDQLKGLVEKLPEETAKATIRLYLKGYFDTAVQLLNEFSQNQARFGREHAISKMTLRTELLLNDLTNAGHAFVSDRSEALCPVAAAAWHIELQVLSNCIPFDDIRISNEAKYYDEAFTFWITKIKSVIEDTNKKIVEIRHGINKSQSYIDYDCYVNFGKKSKSRKYGNDGNLTATKWTVSGRNKKLIAKPASGNERLQLYRKAFETLVTAGIQIDPVYMEIQPLEWTNASKPENFEKEDRENQTAAAVGAEQLYQKMTSNACKDSLDVEKFAKEENDRLPLIEPLFMKMLVYGHYLLVCMEGQRSTRSIIERVPQLMTKS